MELIDPVSRVIVVVLDGLRADAIDAFQLSTLTSRGSFEASQPRSGGALASATFGSWAPAPTTFSTRRRIVSPRSIVA